MATRTALGASTVLARALTALRTRLGPNPLAPSHSRQTSTSADGLKQTLSALPTAGTYATIVTPTPGYIDGTLKAETLNVPSITVLWSRRNAMSRDIGSPSTSKVGATAVATAEYARIVGR